LLPFFITLVESIHLRDDFVKALTHFISKRPNLSLQFLPQKQPQRSHFLFSEWHAALFIIPLAFVQETEIDKGITKFPLLL
jgi:hypothetical protein